MHALSSDDIDIEMIQTHATSVCDLITIQVTPHMTSKNIIKLSEMFQILSNTHFLNLFLRSRTNHSVVDDKPNDHGEKEMKNEEEKREKILGYHDKIRKVLIDLLDPIYDDKLPPGNPDNPDNSPLHLTLTMILGE